MNFDTSLCFDRRCVADRARVRSAVDGSRPAAVGSKAGSTICPVTHPQPRVQRGPGWVAVDSIALSRFR